MNNEISGWAVYWVMQLDDVRFGVGFFTIISFLLLVVCLIMLGASVFDPYLNRLDTQRKFGVRIIIFAAPIFVAGWLMMAFVPSTKSAAAIVLVPRIANSQVVQKDLPEIYQLAIGKLKETLAVEDKEKSK